MQKFLDRAPASITDDKYELIMLMAAYDDSKTFYYEDQTEPFARWPEHAEALATLAEEM